MVTIFCLLFKMHCRRPEFWLYELLTAIEDNGVVAVSCAEFPREDADLFYRAMSWNHNKFMEVDNQDRILCKPIHENHLTLRKNGQLSDIACMISREVFMKYKFKGDYAEDLDLGIRLIRDGHKLALLSSTRVIHSHNRPAYYHLRRGYIDDLFLTQILPDRPVPAIIIEGLFRDITYTTEIINQIVYKKLPDLVLPCAPNKLYSLVLKEFQSGAKGRYGSVSGDMHGNGYVDDKFRSFIENVNDRCQLNGQNSSCDGVLISSMESFTKVIFEYVDETYELIDEELLEDFKSCLFKQFAFQCGLHLCSSFTRGSDSIKKELEEINRELSQEI